MPRQTHSDCLLKRSLIIGLLSLPAGVGLSLGDGLLYPGSNRVFAQQTQPAQTEQPAPTEQPATVQSARVTAQQKLMARRAAQMDAYRQLAERVMGLRIDGGTRVADFIGGSDRLSSAFDRFIKGARITRIVYYDDGSCEVYMEMDVQDIGQGLRRMHQQQSPSRQWLQSLKDHLERFEENQPNQTIRVIGGGAVRPVSQVRDPRDADSDFHVLGEPGGRPAVERGDFPFPEVFRRYPAHQRLMARRAAQMDAYRQLVERVYGLQIASETQVEDFITVSDRITATIAGYIQGARVSDVRYQPDGSVEVQMKLSIEHARRILEQARRAGGSGQAPEVGGELTHRLISVVGVGSVDPRSRRQQAREISQRGYQPSFPHAVEVRTMPDNAAPPQAGGSHSQKNEHAPGPSATDQPSPTQGSDRSDSSADQTQDSHRKSLFD
jgi:hypothetical protein